MRYTKLVCALAISALAAILLVACGSSSNETTGEGGGGGEASGGSLNILSWDGYDEPEWLKQFEQESGISVTSTSVGSPAEMFSKVKANPSQYDIVLATAGWFPQYVEADLLEPIDEAEVPAMKDIKLGFPWEEATSVEGTLYGILYNWGNQALAWLPEEDQGPRPLQVRELKGELDDWNVFWDPALKGKVSIFDDPTSVEPMIGLALGFKNPYQLNEQQFEEFEKKLLELRPQVKRLTTGYDDQLAQLQSGEASVAYLNIISIAAALKQEGTTLDVNNLVKQGVPAWSDNLAITKEGGGKQPRRRLQVHQRLARPEVAGPLHRHDGELGHVELRTGDEPGSEGGGPDAGETRRNADPGNPAGRSVLLETVVLPAGRGPAETPQPLERIQIGNRRLMAAGGRAEVRPPAGVSRFPPIALGGFENGVE